MNSYHLCVTHRLFAAALLFVGLQNGGRAAIDENATRQIWKLKYGVTDSQLADQAWLNQDSDGDGQSNGNEIAAGTSPFIGSQTVKITSITKTGSNVDLVFPTENGKRYQVESTTALTNAAVWTLQPQPTPLLIVGDGAEKTATVAFAANTFYRVRVSDLDSDNDGVADWAEKAVGLNHLSGQTVAGVNDGAYVTEQIALPNVVTIRASSPFASEDGPTAGKMTVTRSQNLFPLTVKLNVGGTAQPGTDYSLNGTDFATQTSTLVFPARGAKTSDIFVNPEVLPAVKGGRSVTATVAPPAATDFPFSVSGQDTATVIINDSTVPSGTGLLARYYDTASTTAADAANLGQAGTFTYTRVGASPYTGSSIVIPYTYAGTPALKAGDQVKVTFTSGSLNSATYNHLNYTVVAVSPGVNFTLGIAGAGLSAINGYSGSCNFSIQSFPHPAVATRVEPTINLDWVYGTPNDTTIQPNSPVDNYSTVYEGYLSPVTAGSYQFQLDADDRARVLIDLNRNGTFEEATEQVLEHGWDTAATSSPIDGNADNEIVGTFKVSAAVALLVPTTPAERYRIRVEHVETTGDARCRLQWRLGSSSFANIPQANVFSHTRALTSYSVASAVATVKSTAHSLTAGNPVTLYFSSGTLFTPPADFSRTYTVASVVDADTFTISVPGAANQTNGAGFMADSGSATTGWLNQTFTNVNFTAPAGRVAIDATGATSANNGIWGSGAPDPSMGKDTFSARWSGQVQPQFTEDYTFTVLADDGVTLSLNGQVQPLRMLPSASTSGSTYTYDATTGNLLVNYAGLAVPAGSFVSGETVRIDLTSGNLAHPSTPSPTYTYDGVTAIVDYGSVPFRTSGSFTAGESVELDPTSGGIGTLPNQVYTVLASPAPTATTFAVAITPTLTIANISPGNPCVVTTAQNHGLTTGATVKIASVTGGNFSPAIDAAPYSVTVISPTAFSVASNCTSAPDIGIGTVAPTLSGNITINDTRNTTITSATATTFTVNIGAGKYPNGSNGNVSDDIANKAFKDWSSNGNERYVRIPMVGGARYDIQLDYYRKHGVCPLSPLLVQC